MSGSEPIFVLDVFRDLHREMLELLHKLSEPDWDHSLVGSLQPHDITERLQPFYLIKDHF